MSCTIHHAEMLEVALTTGMLRNRNAKQLKRKERPGSADAATKPATILGCSDVMIRDS
jgi:hypothetical protein